MKSLAMISLLFLSACASYEETFECEVGRGVGCRSLSAVNSLIDQGKLPLTQESGARLTESKIHAPQPPSPLTWDATGERTC